MGLDNPVDSPLTAEDEYALTTWEEQMADESDPLLDGDAPEGADLPVEGDGLGEGEQGGAVDEPILDEDEEHGDEDEGDEPPVEAAGAAAGAKPKDGTPISPTEGWKRWRASEKERKALLTTVTESERRYNELQSELRQLQQQIHQPAQQQPAYNPNGPQPGQAQPSGWTAESLAQLADEDPIQYSRVVAELSYQAAIQNSQQNEVVRTQMLVQSQISDFRSRTPDYIDAMKHLEGREVERLKAAGLPEAQIPQMIQFRASQLMDIALRTGRNVGELAYAVAKADGWAGAQPPQAQPAARPAQTPAQKVAASRAKTQQAAGSVAGMPGSATGGLRIPESLEDLNALSEKDLDELDEKAPNWHERFMQSA